MWVNRVDLFADWQGWNLGLEDAQRFVCRADARRTYEIAGTLTGFEFGSRKTKTFLARLYDKTADMAAKDNGWWLEVWGDRYVPGPPVHRLEFEIGRQGLLEFDLEHAGAGARRRRRPVGLRHWGMVDVPLPHRRPDPFPLAARPGVALGPTGHARPRARRPRAPATGPALQVHRKAAAGPHRLPRLHGRSPRYRAASTTRWARSGIICTPTRSSASTAFAERVARRRSELELR